MNNKLLLPDLVQALVEEGYDRATAEAFCRSLFSQIERGVFAGETVKVTGLGNFKLQSVDARKSVNVTTGEQIEIKGHYKFSYTPDANFKEMVNRPFAHLESVALPEQEEGPLFDVLDIEALPKPENQPLPVAGLHQAAVFDEPAAEVPQTTLAEKLADKEVPQPTLADKLADKEVPQPTLADKLADKEVPQPTLADKLADKEVPQPTLADKLEMRPQQPEAERENKNKKGMWWSLLISLLVLAAVLYFLFHFFSSSEPKIQTSEPETLIQETGNEPVQILSDSLSAPTQDSIASNDSIMTEETAASEPSSEEALPTSAPSEWPVREIVEVQRGDRLTLLAQNAYGDKIFWIYLFEANRDQLKNPNLLPAGARIRIPDIPASLLDMSRPETMERIHQLEEALKKEFD